MSFKDRLKELRKENKLTQDELGSVLGFTRAAISGYEIGRNQPSIEDLNKLAEYFEVTVDYLIGRTDKKNTIVKEIMPGVEIAQRLSSKKNYDAKDLELAFKIIDLFKENK